MYRAILKSVAALVAALAFVGFAANAEASTGYASYYGNGDGFAGKSTANGETFNPGAMTAASPYLPFGSLVRVTNRATGASVVVRINDRGPFVGGRIIDLSVAAAGAIGMISSGVAPVDVELVGSGGGRTVVASNPVRHKAYQQVASVTPKRHVKTVVVASIKTIKAKTTQVAYYKVKHHRTDTYTASGASTSDYGYAGSNANQ